MPATQEPPGAAKPGCRRRPAADTFEELGFVRRPMVRLHIDRDGALTVYPIGIDRVGRKWEVRPDDPPTAPWLATVGPTPAAHLIEDPVRIRRDGAPTTPYSARSATEEDGCGRSSE